MALAGLLTLILAAPAAGPLPATLESLLLDEYQAEASYALVLRELGEVRPFSNIVQAERRHAEMLEGLMRARGLAVPARPAAGPALDTSSRAAACRSAIQAEERNAALYDEALKADLPDDVRGVLEHNRDASRLHHLPAFQRCAGLPAGSGPGRGHGCGHGRGPRR